MTSCGGDHFPTMNIRNFHLDGFGAYWEEKVLILSCSFFYMIAPIYELWEEKCHFFHCYPVYRKPHNEKPVSITFTEESCNFTRIKGQCPPGHMPVVFPLSRFQRAQPLFILNS